MCTFAYMSVHTSRYVYVYGWMMNEWMGVYVCVCHKKNIYRTWDVEA